MMSEDDDVDVKLADFGLSKLLLGEVSFRLRHMLLLSEVSFRLGHMLLLGEISFTVTVAGMIGSTTHCIQCGLGYGLGLGF